MRGAKKNAVERKARKMKYGEWLVGVNFNPSGNPKVDAIKKKAAALINEIDSIPENQTDVEVLEEVRYQKHAAIRTVELASMEGVKAATKEGRN